jgi:hypothetical protein
MQRIGGDGAESGLGTLAWKPGWSRVMGIVLEVRCWRVGEVATPGLRFFTKVTASDVMETGIRQYIPWFDNSCLVTSDSGDTGLKSTMYLR